MTALHLVRLPIDPPRMLRFARDHGITLDDEDLGYTLHAWLAALFGPDAPKPFRQLPQRNEVLAYARCPHVELLDHARAFAGPQAWAALDESGVASKPMPKEWRQGQRLHVEVLACPVTRKDDDEKDVYLRALDRLGDGAPPRAEIYREWFVQQWKGAVAFDRIELLGMGSRRRMLRRARNGGSRLKSVERPHALFGANVAIEEPGLFGELLARGIGRHRAFGFGMVMLAPAQ